LAASLSRYVSIVTDGSISLHSRATIMGSTC
jgi:hypothetical protein